MAAELEVHEKDTVSWGFVLKRGGIPVNLVNASAKLSVPFLGISDAVLGIDEASSEVTYSPSVSDTEGKTTYRTPGYVVATFVDGSTDTFPYYITVKPRGPWPRVSPTTSTSSSTSTSTTSTSSSTSTTTTL